MTQGQGIQKLHVAVGNQIKRLQVYCLPVLCLPGAINMAPALFLHPALLAHRLPVRGSARSSACWICCGAPTRR